MLDLGTTLNAILDTLRTESPSHPSLNLPGSDDTAVIAVEKGCVVLTSDFINYTPAILSLGVGSLRDYGYLLAGNNLSDLCSTGARPVALLLNLMLPSDFETQNAVEIVEGFQSCAQESGALVVGGDTKGGRHLVGCGTAIGIADDATALFQRTGAAPGQRLCMSGPIGDFSAATYALSKSNIGLPRSLKECASRMIRRPHLPLTQSRYLYENRIARAGIDISDGLGGDLRLLAEASHIGLVIDIERIPISDFTKEIAERFGIPPQVFAFASGGDWQFAFTCESAPRETDEGFFSEIGRVTQQPDLLLEGPNGVRPLPRWRHLDFRYSSFSEEIVTVVDSLAREWP